jgi:hypothetical protein
VTGELPLEMVPIRVSYAMLALFLTFTVFATSAPVKSRLFLKSTVEFGA